MLKVRVYKKIFFGKEFIRGFGVGNNLKIGEEVVKESEREIREVFEGVDMVFIICGFGGGIGIGVVLVVVEIVKKMGVLMVVVVIFLFIVEGIRRIKNVEYGFERFKKNIDIVIVILNDKFMEVVLNLLIYMVFKVVDEIFV